MPTPITETYGDFESLSLSIDRYLKTLAYFHPKVVICKDKRTHIWTLTVYNQSQWKAWKRG